MAAQVGVWTQLAPRPTTTPITPPPPLGYPTLMAFDARKSVPSRPHSARGELTPPRQRVREPLTDCSLTASGGHQSARRVGGGQPALPLSQLRENCSRSLFLLLAVPRNHSD